MHSVSSISSVVLKQFCYAVIYLPHCNTRENKKKGKLVYKKTSTCNRKWQFGKFRRWKRNFETAKILEREIYLFRKLLNARIKFSLVSGIRVLPSFNTKKVKFDRIIWSTMHFPTFSRKIWTELHEEYMLRAAGWAFGGKTWKPCTWWTLENFGEYDLWATRGIHNCRKWYGFLTSWSAWLAVFS